MVETVIDAMRVPSITLSQAELDEIEGLISAGQLAPDFMERHLEAVARNVFGVDHKTDQDNSLIEQGIGSPANQSRNSINAYKKYAKYEFGYNEEEFKKNCLRMEAELAACNAARAAANKARAALAAATRGKRK